MSNIHNENTLYRFSSQRNPELVVKDGIKRRFVYHPNSTGPIFNAVANRPANTTKWSALQSFTGSFSAFSKEKDVQDEVTEAFFDSAVWVSRNRYDFDPTIMLSRVSAHAALALPKKLTLWDNLFYQVTQQREFYIKESIIQALVLDNMIEQLALLGSVDEKKKKLPELANARVVLPTLLYDEGKTLGQVYTPDPVDSSDPKAAAINAAKDAIEKLEGAKKDIEGVQIKFRKESDLNYSKAVAAWESLQKDKLDNYNANWRQLKRNACSSPLPGTTEVPGPLSYCSEPDVELPQYDSFEFDRTEPITDLSLHIPQASFNAVAPLIEKFKLETYQEILDALYEKIQEQHKIIAENSNFTQSVLVVNGVRMQPQDGPVKPVYTGVTPPKFMPERFGVRKLGIADYKKVVSHVCCYAAGEVAGIENIMARELRSKTTMRERTEENTETTELSTETENLTDTTTTERFQMQTEVANLLQQQKQFTAGSAFHAGWGIGGANFSLDASASFSSATSKEQSNRQAVMQAKDLTQRAMERVVTKMRKEIIKKTIEKFREENIHEFDNREGANHVSGVYRFINAVYKNQIYNYGKRLMFEFMIPQPSKLHRLGMLQNTNHGSAVVLQKPIDPRTLGYSNFEYLSETNYAALAGAYGATEIEPPPSYIIYVDYSFSKADINPAQGNTYPYHGMQGYAANSTDFKIPEGYQVESVKGSYSGREIGINIQNPKVALTIGGRDGLNLANTYYQQNGTSGNRIEVYFQDQKIREKLTISLSTWDERAFTVNVVAKCTLTPEAYRAWQTKAYKEIIDAYNRKLEEYNSSLEGQNVSQTLGTNPGFYRQTEQMVLRKNCISYLMDELQLGQSFYTGNSFGQFKVSQTAPLDNYANLAKFLEQGFEWDMISYNFYPFYWGNRNEWTDLYQYDCDDPLFRSFMQAGLARVVVTVKPGFEDAIMLYLATGQIWNGGEIPVVGDPLYLSIVDELKEQEYVVEDTWETVVPTSLVALQSSGVAINAQGLPCGDECDLHLDSSFVPNGSTLGT